MIKDKLQNKQMQTKTFISFTIDLIIVNVVDDHVLDIQALSKVGVVSFLLEFCPMLVSEQHPQRRDRDPRCVCQPHYQTLEYKDLIIPG